MNFLYFEKQDGVQINCAKISGYQLFGDQLEDAEFKLTIKDGKILIDSFNNIDFLGNNCDQEINEDIKSVHIDWNNGYEFLDYSDINDNSVLQLVADSRSDMFNVLNSQQNISNLNKIKKVI